MSDLRDAAQAVIDRWNTPLWKDAPSTASYIYALRDALAADKAQDAQPCPGCGKTTAPNTVHTCSPQVRELSDEEIVKVSEDVTRTYRVEEQPSIFALRFARAILAAAKGEK